MPLFNMQRLRALLPQHARLLGLDPGRRTIGIALSDVSLLIASPYATIKRAKLLTNGKEIRHIAQEEGAGGLVCGLPLSLNGTFGPAAQQARDWLLALSEATALPAALWDERLSSCAVNRLLISEADLTREHRAKVIDKLAASYILQSALDASAPDYIGGGRDRV